MFVREFFFSKNNAVIMSQTAHSPDLSNADFYPFPKLKTPLKETRFATIEEIKEKSKQELLVIPKSAFRKCSDDWEKCWYKCIISEGGYFEGDTIVIDKLTVIF